jgi:hypothetical protein
MCYSKNPGFYEPGFFISLSTKENPQITHKQQFTGNRKIVFSDSL